MTAEPELTLTDLGMDALSSRALATLPLVQVAWADGSIKAKERERILRAADDALGLGEEGARLLQDWLLHRPSERYFHAGRSLLRALAVTPRSGFDEPLLRKVLTLSEEAARASGGLCGWFRTGAAEKRILDSLRADLTALSGTTAVKAISTAAHSATMLANDDDDAPRMVGVIIVGEGEARRKVLVGQEGLILGSGPTANLQFQGRDVAPEHVRVFEHRRRYYVVDLGSKAGTLVGGERIGHRRVLGGETIRLGDQTAVFKMGRREG